jgi:hypothetical protein
VSKALCSSQAVRWTDILLATLLPWIIIFFSLFMILKIFPGWITPFSNTVGYLVISILGVETTLTNILNSNEGVGGDLAKAIANITHNKSNFINQIDINKTTFLNFINDLINAKIIILVKKPDKAGAEATTGAVAEATEGATVKAAGAKRPEIDKAILTNSDIQNLYKLLVIKNVLGQITWYVLAGVLVSSVSYNYIINMSCDKSLEEITTDLNNAEAKSLEYAQGS